MSDVNAPSGFDWLGAVWDASESQAQATLDSQLVDAKGLSLATKLQATLGSSHEEFNTPSFKAGSGSYGGNMTIQQVISLMTQATPNQVSVVNSIVASQQQEQSLNTQTAGQFVQSQTNQATQVDNQNQTSVTQRLGSLVSSANGWGSWQLN